MEKNANDKTVIITGMSGAGMSSVLKAMEDMGYEAFDNFPLFLIDQLIENRESDTKFAIGLDTRTRGFETAAVLNAAHRHMAKLLFVNCEDAVLQKRYTETRRRHPLARDKSVSAGIKKERAQLKPLLDAADIVIDTTDLSIHDLRHTLEGHFVQDSQKNLKITLMSFGFKYGVPREADIVMDVRFLQNPHWEPALKPLSGLDRPVGEHIEQDPGFADFLSSFQSLLSPLLPRYAEEGKKYLTIAMGCTGGRHRSVYVTKKMGAWLEEQGFKPYIEHRDLDG